jgi:hypothetical protein
MNFIRIHRKHIPTLSRELVAKGSSLVLKTYITSITDEATRDSFYLDIGERVLEDLTRRTKVACGLSTISNLLTSTQEDRMESFALSESLKVHASE